MFTDKELKVARMKLKGLMNKEIAKELTVSEADISQTLSRLSRKVKTVQDSTELLAKMGLIQGGPKYTMTEKGRKLARLQEKKAHIAEHAGVLVIVLDNYETGRVEETSEAYSLIPYGSFVAGEEKIISSLWGISEAKTGTLNKKTIKASSTLEPLQRIEVPWKRGVY